MNDYIKQATDFLEATGTEFSIVFQYTGPYFQGDKEFRDVYRFTLKNTRGEYSGTFGDSIANTKKRTAPPPNIFESSEAQLRAAIANKKHVPSAYDVLSCLEKYQPDTFANWASDYGYNDQPLSEYPAVMAIYTACVDQYKGLARIFTPEQMEVLQEIS